MRAGWETKRLGDACLVDRNQGTHRDLVYVGLEQIEAHTGRYLGSGDAEDVKSSTFRFGPEHVLYGRLRPYLNKVLAPDFSGHCSTEIFPLRARPGVLRELLFYWLRRDATVALAEATCRGARMPRANVDELLEAEFILPPLPEQRRIVAILDEAFEGIATAKANAEKNLENARALFETQQSRMFEKPASSWPIVALGQIASFRNGVNFTKASRGQQLKIVGVKDFAGHTSVPLGQLADVVVNGELRDDDLLQPADILFVRSNGSIDLIGRCLLVEEVPEPTTFSGFTIRARLTDTTRLLPSYLGRVLRSGHLRARMIAGGNGANIKSLNQGILSALPIPVPSPEAQREVVAGLDEFEDAAKRVESVYQRKLDALDELKRSLLHHAFSGAL